MVAVKAGASDEEVGPSEILYIASAYAFKRSTKDTYDEDRFSVEEVRARVCALVGDPNLVVEVVDGSISYKGLMA